MLPSVRWTGAALIALGASVFAWKVLVARVPLLPAQGERLWRVELEISVRGRGQRGSVRAALPSTEPGQRIMDEGVVSQQLDHSVRNEPGGRVAVWGGRLDGIFFCPHAADSTCDCRKPKPGMLLQIAERFNVELADVPCVGDGLRDLQAAAAAGAKPYLVLTGKGEATQASGGLPPGTQVYPDLDAVAAALTA